MEAEMKATCRKCGKPIGHKAVGDIRIRQRPNGKGAIVGYAYAHPNREIRGNYHVSCMPGIAQ